MHSPAPLRASEVASGNVQRQGAGPIPGSEAPPAARRRAPVEGGPTLADFMRASAPKQADPAADLTANVVPYLGDASYGKGRTVFLETYGCQMNVSDTEIVWSILKASNYTLAADAASADVVLLVTCAIRDNAERRIWGRLRQLRAAETALLKELPRCSPLRKPRAVIGVLGCMAERLKEQLLEGKERLVDVVCGPDAYRDLPRLLGVAEAGEKGVNVQLSLDETYADVAPVRLCEDGFGAFVSIMRGCDNMCSYCIVPFTRGRERSRPVTSIINEVRALAESGTKEITLLGQNCNSYRDTSSDAEAANPMTEMAAGFKTVYKPKIGGLRFADLLDRVAQEVPGVRIRFTSPHPKDFPDRVFEVMARHPNICKQVHLPAQSGSSRMLERMRRGYTRDAYVSLVERIREMIPGVALSSDFIVGFCGETEEDYQMTLSLVDEVGYDMAFLFAYSLREKTHAHRNYVDDVPADEKKRRLQGLIDLFRARCLKRYATLVGSQQLVLVEGPYKRGGWFGRDDGGRRVVFGPGLAVPSAGDVMGVTGAPADSARLRRAEAGPGDWVAVIVDSSSANTLQSTPVVRLEGGLIEYERWKASCSVDAAARIARQNEELAAGHGAEPEACAAAA